MSRKGANVSLASYDDIFETDKSREEDQLEKVQKIPLIHFRSETMKK